MNANNSPKSVKLVIILSIIAFSVAFLCIIHILYRLEQMKKADSNVSRVLAHIFTNIQPNQYNSASFDLSSTQGYLRINSSSGYFLVSLQNVEPYLDGVKVHIHIGNPMFVTYNGFKLKAIWGAKLNLTDGQDGWRSSLKDKEISFTETLRPGCWNKINFVLSPIEPKNFGYLELSIQTDNISLINPIE